MMQPFIDEKEQYRMEIALEVMKTMHGREVSLGQMEVSDKLYLTAIKCLTGFLEKE